MSSTAATADENTFVANREIVREMSRNALEEKLMMANKTRVHHNMTDKIAQMNKGVHVFDDFDSSIARQYEVLLSVLPDKELREQFASLKASLVVPAVPTVEEFAKLSDVEADAVVSKFEEAKATFRQTLTDLSSMSKQLVAPIEDARIKLLRNAHNWAEEINKNNDALSGRTSKSGDPSVTRLPANPEVDGRVVVYSHSESSVVDSVEIGGTLQSCLLVYIDPTANERAWTVYIPQSMMSSRKADISNSTFAKKCKTMCKGGGQGESQCVMNTKIASIDHDAGIICLHVQ